MPQEAERELKIIFPGGGGTLATHGQAQLVHYIELVGQHGVARDFYYQLSLPLSPLLSLYVFLSLFLSISLFLSLFLSVSLSPDKKFPALDPSLVTSHLYSRYTKQRKYIENSLLKRRKVSKTKMGKCGGKGTVPAECENGDQVPTWRFLSQVTLSQCGPAISCGYTKLGHLYKCKYYCPKSINLGN